MPAVMWFRRDLRLTDHPALSAAAATGPVLPLFVLDPVLLGSAGAPRKAYLSRSLAALDDSLDGCLVIRTGDPATVVPEVAREVGATTVHVSAECTPYGRRRDARVIAAGVRARGNRVAVRRHSGTVADRSRHAVPGVHAVPAGVAGARLATTGGPPDSRVGHGQVGPSFPSSTSDADLPRAGESAARARWERFLENSLDGYPEDRDRPDLRATSYLSMSLRFGEVHPRTLLADLARVGGAAAAKFRAELGWRDFHADVLWHRPDATTTPAAAELPRHGVRRPRPGVRRVA